MADIRSAPVTLRLPEDVLREIGAIAETLDRSRSWVMVRALRAYLATEGRQILDLAAGRREAEAGEFVDSDEVLQMLQGDLTLVGGSKAR